MVSRIFYWFIVSADLFRTGVVAGGVYKFFFILLAKKAALLAFFHNMFLFVTVNDFKMLQSLFSFDIVRLNLRVSREGHRVIRSSNSITRPSHKSVQIEGLV